MMLILREPSSENVYRYTETPIAQFTYIYLFTIHCTRTAMATNKRLFLHIIHRTSYILLYVHSLGLCVRRRCLVKAPFWVNDLSRTSHWYGFSPCMRVLRCVCDVTRSCPFSVNHLSHALHWYIRFLAAVLVTS